MQLEPDYADWNQQVGGLPLTVGQFNRGLVGNGFRGVRRVPLVKLTTTRHWKK